MTPKNKIKIKVTTSIKVKPINAFALDCKRSYAYINKSIDAGDLNFAVAFKTPNVRMSGIKLVVMDDKAKGFKKACQQRDKIKAQA